MGTLTFLMLSKSNSVFDYVWSHNLLSSKKISKVIMDQLPCCIFLNLKGVFHLSLLCVCVCDVFVDECWCTRGNQSTIFLTLWFLGIELDPISLLCKYFHLLSHLASDLSIVSAARGCKLEFLLLFGEAGLCCSGWPQTCYVGRMNFGSSGLQLLNCCLYFMTKSCF